MLHALLAAALASAPSAPEAPIAVIALDAASTPAAELVEMTHQLRAACRERAPAVQDVRDMRARLLGDRASSSLAELERAFAGALLTEAHGDAAAAARTLRGIVAELELGPESTDAFGLWTRAQLRLAHAELANGRAREYRDALERLADVNPAVRADPDQYSPSFRRELDAARARVAARPRHALRISAALPGAPGHANEAGQAKASSEPVAVFVDGRPVGAAPAALSVSGGKHRVGAAKGSLRVPTVTVEVGPDDVDVALDVALAAAVDVNAGPALALAATGRETAIVKLGAWLDAARVLTTSVAVDSGVTFLVGALYDVQRGSLLREGRVRTSAGLAAPEHLAALSSFLLTGQPSAAVLTAAPPGARRTLDLSATVAAPDRRSWMRPAALGSAAVALGAGALTVHQLFAARSAAADAEAMIRADGTIVGDSAVYARHRDAASAARRNVWIGATGTAVFAAAAGALGYLSWERGAPVVRF
ncbi:MAG TPA: hypothetical protein VFK85_02960 [Anaeromyxobacteraceae bacterium]|nr:hypothetical protein [Anaeromyxobacteraceae bacterium]